MSPSNVYGIYGMKVRSSLALPAPSVIEQEDVTITQQSLPEVLSNQFLPHKKLQFDGERVLLKPSLFGKLLLNVNGHLHYDFHPDLIDAHAITALLGSGLGVMLHLQGHIPLHGMAIASPHGAIIILADSGMGKSTLATSLLQANIPIFSDDIVALRQAPDGCLHVHPAHRRIKLALPQLQAMALNVQALSTTAPGVDKLGWDIPTALFAHHPMPVKACIFLQTEKKPHTADIVPISLRESFRLLRKNVYRPRLIQAFNHEERFFSLNQQLQNQCQSYTMALPQLSAFSSTKDYGEALAHQLLGLSLSR